MTSGKWKSSRRATSLPPDWSARRRACAERAGGRCEANSQITDWGREFAHGTRCERPGAEADHALGRDDHRVEALQWLCEPHHAKKTQKEAQQARAARKRPPRREERHPGLR